MYTPSIILKEIGKRESYQLTIIDSICDSLENLMSFVLLNIFSMWNVLSCHHKYVWSVFLFKKLF